MSDPARELAEAAALLVNATRQSNASYVAALEAVAALGPTVNVTVVPGGSLAAIAAAYQRERNARAAVLRAAHAERVKARQEAAADRRESAPPQF